MPIQARIPDPVNPKTNPSERVTPAEGTDRKTDIQHENRPKNDPNGSPDTATSDLNSIPPVKNPFHVEPGIIDRFRKGTPTDEDLLWTEWLAANNPTDREHVAIRTRAKAQAALAAADRIIEKERITRGADPTVDQQASHWDTLDKIATTTPGALIVDRYHPTAHTIIYGPGGVGKGATVANDVIRMVRAGLRVLICDYERNDYEWKGRIFTLGGEECMPAIAYYYPSKALWDEIDDLRLACVTHKADVLVIDSIVYACIGTDVSTGGTEAPIKYADALDTLGIPVISLGHVTKANPNPEYPFGSAFWANSCRLSYSLTQEGAHRTLQRRKTNNYPPMPKVQVELFWSDNRLVKVEEQPLAQASEDLLDVLDHPMTLKQIHAAVNAGLHLVDPDAPEYSPKTIETAVTRGYKANVYAKAGMDKKETLWIKKEDLGKTVDAAVARMAGKAGK